MKIKRFAGFKLLLLLLIFIQNNSSARIRNLSLEMEPTVFEAHWWLGFDKKAGNVKWLKKQIAVHLDEDNDDYHNLAALLRMYYEYAPKSNGIEYANQLVEQFKNDEYSIDEINMFKSLYLDDSYINSPYEEDAQKYNSESLIAKLSSNSSIIDAIHSSRYYGKFNVLSDNIINIIIGIYLDDGHFARSAAYHFLVEYSYVTEHDPNEQGTDELGRITITSGLGANLTQYLVRYSYSPTWKFYAKRISSISGNGYVSHESELEHFFVEMHTYEKPDFRKKINFIKKLKTYKQTSVSFKINAAEELMLCHPKQGAKILKKAYNNANPVIQSTLHARYPDIFQYDEKYWRQALVKSNKNAQKLIKHNFERMKIKVNEMNKPNYWYYKHRIEFCK